MDAHLERFYGLRNDYLRAVERVVEVLVLEEAEDARTAAIRRDALIQRFEFTFELGWKTMQSLLRWQGLVAPSPRDVIRQAPVVGLLSGDDEVASWLAMLEDRTAMSHTYRETRAEVVAEHIRTLHADRLRSLAERLPSLPPLFE